jgi:DNA-binding NtrC family response regulator
MSALAAINAFPDSGAALIASPNSTLRQQVLDRLNGRCRPVQQATGGADALAKLENAEWQVLFLDRDLPDLDAGELISIIQKRFPNIQVVLLDRNDALASNSTTTRTVAAPARVWEQAVSRRAAEKTSATVRTMPLPGMIGTSEPMENVYRMVRLVAARSTTVLITGPTGTGKELVARALHILSQRASRPFVVVNCAAIPETLLESELFGYSRGAFTGAVQSQVGRIAAANGGTLFLDEVSELPLGMQAKLLRFLEQKEVQRLGSSDVTHVDVRVVAASNTDLARQAARGKFRQDLFYRLSAFPIELPPLAKRADDIVPLAEHFLRCMAAALEMPVPNLSEEAIRLLREHSWKGNVRELQHVMERASILAETQPSIAAEHLYFSVPQEAAWDPAS